MENAEFNTFEKVVITTNQKKAMRYTTDEQKAEGMGDIERSEVVTQLATVINKQYCTTKDTENDKDTVIYDGWVYHCDNGQAYFPGLENNGHVVQLRKATEEDIKKYS